MLQFNNKDKIQANNNLIKERSKIFMKMISKVIQMTRKKKINKKRKNNKKNLFGMMVLNVKSHYLFLVKKIL